jgi:hypothetical protein
MPSPIGAPRKKGRDQPVVRRDAGHHRKHDQGAEGPSAQAGHNRRATAASHSPQVRKRPRLCTQRAIERSEATMRSARPIIRPTMAMASPACVCAGVRSTV